jgi:asparagine synthase (glutamine-hydrolysing)
LSQYLPVTPRKVGFSYKLRQFLTVPSDDGDRAHFWWRVVFPPAGARAILFSDLRRGVQDHDPFETFAAHAVALGQRDSLSRGQYVDLKTFLSDSILVKVDRATMAHALEARSPFLDFRLIEWALSLPDRLKVHGSEQKVLLRRLMRNRLPGSTLRQPKRGFNAPVSAWLKGPLREMATELFASASLRSVGLLDPSAVASVWTAHLRGWQDQGFRLWVLFTFLVWWHNVARQRPEGTE